MEYDYTKLRGRIREKLWSESMFAEAIGRSRSFVSMAFNGKAYFEQEDIVKAVDALGIQPKEIGEYFFAGLSTETQQENMDNIKKRNEQ